jgi:hypothetical protein
MTPSGCFPYMKATVHFDTYQRARLLHVGRTLFVSSVCSPAFLYVGGDLSKTVWEHMSAVATPYSETIMHLYS